MVPGYESPSPVLKKKYQTNAMGFAFLISAFYTAVLSTRQTSADVLAGSRDPHARVFENTRDRGGFANRDRDEIDVEFREHDTSDPVPERLDELVLLVRRNVLDDLENPLVVDGPPDSVAMPQPQDHSPTCWA